MKQLTIFASSIALTCFAVLPTLAMANDDLEVTMEVFDDLSAVDGSLHTMAGPGESGSTADLDPDGAGDMGNGDDGQMDDDDEAGDDFENDGTGGDLMDNDQESGDDFEHDDSDDDAMDDDLESEGDFEDGEDVDHDEYDDMDDESDDDGMDD